jgi:hypothetical protein
LDIIDSLKKVLSPFQFLFPAIIAVWFLFKDFTSWSLSRESRFFFIVLLICIYCSISLWLGIYLFKIYKIQPYVFIGIFIIPLAYVSIRLGTLVSYVPELAAIVIPTIIVEEILHQRFIWEISKLL